MGWLGRWLSGPTVDGQLGITFDRSQPHWEVDGPIAVPAFFQLLADVLPEDAVVVLEAGVGDDEVTAFLTAFAKPPDGVVALGTSWPASPLSYVPATPDAMSALCALMATRDGFYLAAHVHVFRGREVLLAWHDAFFVGTMLLSAALGMDAIRQFGLRLNVPIVRGEPVEAGAAE